MKPDRDNPPAPDEIEVSIFGPGYGECIVIHFGSGNWLIIDSCIDFQKKPIALSYLQRLNVSPTAVRLVAATHWHDDHVRGLANVMEECTNALFCCSTALKSKDFFNLSQVYARAPIDMPAGPEEFNKIFRILRARSNSAAKSIKWSQNDQVLLRQDIVLKDKAITVTLHSLSPSDEMLTRAAIEIAQHYKQVNSGENLGRLVANHPNHVAIAMTLNVGDRSILLGSDLEESGDPLTGWAAVCSSPTRDPRKAMIYKVAHHASASGHRDEVWDRMLIKTPVSLITPFKRGWHKLPTPVDQKQILALTDKAYITADPQADKIPKKRAPKIETMLKATTIMRRRSINSVGQIRWRASMFDESDLGTISLYDGAYQLTN